MQIKIFKNEVKLAKYFFKILKKDIKKNPYIRIGIDGEGLSFLFEDLINFTKINWSFVRIFSPVEYFDGLINSPTSFSEILKNKLAKNLNNFDLNNFEYLAEKINFLKSKKAINGLYKYKDGLDVLIFYLDYRGNFFHNDYESKMAFLNFSTNGSKIVSPGIKSILLAKKIIFICKDDNERSREVIKNFVSKKIIENDMYTFLNFHENFYFLTLKKLIDKSDIALSVSNQDYSLWHNILLSNDLDEIDDSHKIAPSYEIASSHEKENTNLDIVSQNDTLNLDSEKTYIERNEAVSSTSLDNELSQVLLEEKENLISEDNVIDEDINLFEENEKQLSEESVILNDNQINNDFLKDSSEEKNDVFSLGIIDDIKKIISEEKKLDENNFVNSKIEEKETKDNNWASDISFDFNYKDDLNNDNDQLFKEIDSEIKIENNINNFTNYQDDEKNLFFKNEQEVFHKEEEFLDTKQEDWFSNNDFTLETPIKPSDVTPTINHDKPADNKDLSSNFIYVKDDINKKIGSLDEIDKIKKVIEIKQNTLKNIEKIILEINNNKNPIENFLVDKPNNEKLFKYCPGHRPCPLLAVFDTPNQKQYEEILFDMKVIFSPNVNFKPFDNSLKHLWNHSSYISYNEKTLEINLIAFIDFSYLIFLLRYLNKDLWFKTSNVLLDILEKNVNEYDKEFLLLTPRTLNN